MSSIDWDAGRSDGGREAALTSFVLEAARQPGTRPLTRPSLRTIGWATSSHHKGGAATMGTVTGQSVGIDISEDFLDVYFHPAGKEVRLPHNDEGTASLLALLREHPIERVVLESTGGLQRRLVRSLQDAGYSVSVVNPERIWAYRRLVGRVAKTDPVDARVIAECAATIKPAASVPLRASRGARCSRRGENYQVAVISSSRRSPPRRSGSAGSAMRQSGRAWS